MKEKHIFGILQGNQGILNFEKKAVIKLAAFFIFCMKLSNVAE